MKRYLTQVLQIMVILGFSSELYASSASYFMETQVDPSKLDRAQLMAIGSTLPGKLYRTSEGQICMISLASVTKKTETKGFFSSSSTKVYSLSQESAITRQALVDKILNAVQQKPELFQSAMDESKNIDLLALANSNDSLLAENAQTSVRLLDEVCD